MFSAREMMLGLRESFEYLECHRCGCLQLLDPPADWSRYYPADYYSFAAKPDGRLKRLLKRWRARHALGKRSLIGAILVRRWGLPPFAEWIRPAGVGWDDAVLDIGSGAGHALRDMRDAGFSNLTGVDPYVEKDIDLGEGARVLKRYVGEVEGPFDFVMMNHSFEHMDDPEATLAEVARILPSGHVLLVRIPVAGTYAWREYGPDWVQLDAPRHLFLHTEESMRLLAERTGFTVREVRYDSTGFQHWGSEQYRQGIPLHDERSYAVDAGRSIFTPAQIAAFERTAAALNEQRDGDQASFYLVRH